MSVDEALSPLGPLFGPDFIVVTVNDQTGTSYDLEIYPDANNPQLKAAGVATHYYFSPKQVYLAKKATSPKDFDFAMMIFKGLMTSETTMGINDVPVTDGTLETGGGICSFSTTFAIPDSVITGAIAKLKQQDYGEPQGRQLSPEFKQLLNYQQNDPDPELGIITIVNNDVTIEVPDPSTLGKMFSMSAQGNGKGSIEASGISAFLVTCNQFAAGVIGGSLKQGKSPFTVHYNLKEQFYINECHAKVIVDADKTFDQFSAAASGSYFFSSASLAASYQNCITSGAIKTIITMNNAVLADDDPLKKMIDADIEDMRKAALDAVKNEIFDWKPTPDAPATAPTDGGLFSGLFGFGVGVSMKANYQHRGLQFTQELDLNGSIAVYNTISGDLNDLEPAIKANLDKYFTIIDIGAFFQKLQVVAKTNVNWSETLPDGTNLSDPISFAQVEVGYPDFNQPLGADNKPNPQYRAKGFSYMIGQQNPTTPNNPVIWNKTNPNYVFDISFMKLDNPVKDWDPDEVMIRKTISYDPLDPRVDLDGNKTMYQTEVSTKDHSPTITADEVGYLLIQFMVDRPVKSGAITMTLTCTIGNRTDTITITKDNYKNAIWEIFSDKYINETSFTYDLQIEVSSSNFTDNPINWGTQTPVKVDLPAGRIKYIKPLKLPIPPPPKDQVSTINNYIKNFGT